MAENNKRKSEKIMKFICEIMKNDEKLWLIVTKNSLRILYVIEWETIIENDEIHLWNDDKMMKNGD